MGSKQVLHQRVKARPGRCIHAINRNDLSRLVNVGGKHRLRSFAEWGKVFGDPVVATALLDRLLHQAVVVQIECSSYRLRQQADLMPEHVRSKALITPPAFARHQNQEAGHG